MQDLLVLFAKGDWGSTRWPQYGKTCKDLFEKGGRLPESELRRTLRQVFDTGRIQELRVATFASSGHYPSLFVLFLDYIEAVDPEKGDIELVISSLVLEGLMSSWMLRRQLPECYEGDQQPKPLF